MTRGDIYSGGAVGDGTDPGAAPATIFITWVSFRGASPDRLLKGWMSWMSGTCPRCTVAETIVRGKKVAAVTGATAAVVVYAYASGDTVYQITAREASVAEEAIAMLP